MEEKYFKMSSWVARVQVKNTQRIKKFLWTEEGLDYLHQQTPKVKEFRRKKKPCRSSSGECAGKPTPSSVVYTGQQLDWDLTSSKQQ